MRHSVRHRESQATISQGQLHQGWACFGNNGFDAAEARRPDYVTIYGEATGALLATCGFGTTCTATVAQATPGTQFFEAFVGDDVPGSGHPGFALVASNEVHVSWWFIRR